MRGWKKWRFEEIALLRILREEGETVESIAGTLRRTPASVKRRIAHDDLPLGFSPRQRRPGSGRRCKNRELYHSLLVDVTVPHAEVARLCGVTTTAVFYARKRRGVRVSGK